MKHLFIGLAWLLWLACVFAGEPATQGNGSILEDEDFRDALTYCFSSTMYWSPFMLAPPLFEEWGQQASGRLPPSLLGKTVDGRITRSGNSYYADFGKALPDGFNILLVEKTPSGKWGSACFIGGHDKNEEPISENYKFRIPVDFTASAAKFDNDPAPILASLKIALTGMLAKANDAPSGENHFFVGPFRASELPGGLVIYWVEKKEMLSAKPFSHSLDEIEKWDWLDFCEESLEYSENGMFLACKSSSDDPKTQFEKRTIAMRLSCTSVIVANCVRDGKLITVVKRPPSHWSKFKAWLSAKFKRQDSQTAK